MKSDVRIPMSRWGKDHWSTFAYVETLCVDSPDGMGIPNHQRVQTNYDRHPGLAVSIHGENHDGARHGIRLAGGVEMPGPAYDEWDCIDDMEAEGLLANVGTGVNPAYRLTEKGMIVAGQLRAHKARGGRYADFEPGRASGAAPRGGTVG